MLQLVIPAYNEALRLPSTLQALRDELSGDSLVMPLEVIVVDNASTDGTAEVALREHTAFMPVRVVHCSVPGKGAAVRAGMAATTAGLVGFMDADGATDLAALDRGLRLMALGADMAIASRGMPDSVTAVRTSWVRGRGAAAYRGLAKRIVPGLQDTQCGFKLMDGALGRRLFAQLQITGFSFDVELLARARAQGARIAEFGVSWSDVPGSTFVPARHGAGAFVELASIAWTLRDTRRTAITPVGVPIADPVEI